MAAVIAFEHVTKHFDIHQAKLVKDRLLGIAGHRGRSVQFTAVDDASFVIDEGEVVALMGHNGSGKSTCLKMLSRVLAPSSGVIRARGRIASLLEVGAGFHPDLTGRENIFLSGTVQGVSRDRLAQQVDEIVDFAELEDFIDTPVKFYSSGMIVRLGFAIAMNVEPDILLLDEILGVGDAGFQAKSHQRIDDHKAAGRTIVLVTHDATTAIRFCTRAIVLNRGSIAYDGSVEEGIPHYRGSSR